MRWAGRGGRRRAGPGLASGAYAALLGGLAAWVTAPGLAAQDIEALARARGVALPPGHFQMITQTPDLYEFRRALFSRVTPERTAAHGQVGIPVLLALFADSPEVPHVTRDMVQQALFDGPAERGTITQAYAEMSRGALEVGGEVYGWARSTLTMSEVVGTEMSLGPDNRMAEYLLETLEQLDPEIDFSRYDNDGPDGVANSGDDDGFVDVITLEYLEVAASCGGPAIWPHRSSVEGRTGEPFKTDDVGIRGDTIYVSDYITQSATDCGGESVQDAGVITHEFGHALGLPDWYHWVDRSAGPYGRRWVLGCWALMAAGSWGCGPVSDSREPFGPTHMIGYSKAWLGWTDYIEVGEVWNEEIFLDPIQTSGQVLRVPLDEGYTQFLLAEYRALVGFDHQLPAAGVLLYQNDIQASLRPDPATDDPYFLTMLEQDADRSLRLMATEGGSRGEAGDAWGVDGAVDKLDAETTPRLRLRNGNRTTVAIHEVSVEGERARLVISTGLTPRLVEPPGPFRVEKIRTFVEPIRVAGGRGPYVGEADLPAGLSFEAVGDELFMVGSVTDAGPYEYAVAVRDAAGNVSPEIVVTVEGATEWVVELENLLQAFLLTEGDPLTPGELDHLDATGNDNGTYDVGDLRTWLRANGG